MKVVDGGSFPEPSILDGCTFSIGVNNYPEDDISLESVTFLTTTYHALRSVLSVPPPPITDRREAAAPVDWRGGSWSCGLQAALVFILKSVSFARFE